MDLYNDPVFVRSLIVQHANHPVTKLDDKTDLKQFCIAKTASATCTDDITILLKIDNNKIVSANYVGIGCAISTSTTDLLLLAIKDKTINEALKLTNEFITLTTDGTTNEELNDLLVFKNVYKQANRISCAQSAALSVKKILENKNENN